MDWNYFCVAGIELNALCFYPYICFKLHPCFCYVLTKLHNLSKCVTLILTLIVEFLLLGLSEICWKKLVLWSWNWYSFLPHLDTHNNTFLLQVSCRNIVKENGEKSSDKNGYSSLTIDRSKKIPRGASSPAVKNICDENT